MKKLVILSMIIFGLSACSTSEKNDKDNGESAPVNTESEATEAKSDAEAKVESTGSKASCVLDKDTRVIEVKKTESGGCELFYTKFGEAKSVASSGFGTQYCEEVKDRIQSNLVKAGFTCN